jgi:hypothetical protein
MTDLLTSVLDAHGGLDRWRRVARLEIDASLGGPFWASKGWPDVYRDQLIDIDARRFDIAFRPYPRAGFRSRMRALPEHLEIVDDEGGVVEARDDPRTTFPDPATRPTWDALQTAYFTSCACWNYFTEPFVFSRPDVETVEIDPWTEGGETWRRLRVTFPASLPNHNPDQTFYFDDRFLLRRMDYHPDVTDSPIAHYTDEHREFDGLVFPTRRRVHVRDGDGVADLSFAPITIDVADVRVIDGAP